MSSLSVPFKEDSACFTNDFILPATYHLQSPPATRQINAPQTDASGLYIVDTNVRTFYRNELDVSRLNVIHEHLWLAGLERTARPLHQQIAVRRNVILTEAADLHLLWRDDRLYIKPLPEFLLSYAVWTEHLVHDAALHEQAAGFLLSYLWLICHPSDLQMAHRYGIVPESVNWQKWTTIARSVSESSDISNLNGVNIRYRYGELRLHRVNWIYSLCSRTRSPTTLLRGYLPAHHQYGSFIASNLAWLVSVLVYIILVLTAMQVGLATNGLQHSPAFQSASLCFAVFSILAPIGSIFAVLVVTLLMVLLNACYTLRHRKAWSTNSASNASLIVRKSGSEDSQV